MKRGMLIWSAVAFLLASGYAAEVELTWTYTDGKTEVKRQPLEEGTNVYRLRIPRESISPRAKSVSVLPDFARAGVGEDGYWISAEGHMGGFREKEGSFRRDKSPMAFYGMKTPRMTFAAIVTGMPYYFAVDVTAKKGEYTMKATFANHLEKPYEDIAVEYHVLTGKNADYAGMARCYRTYQLERKACRPLRERVKTSKELEYGIHAPEIRIRQAWKPVPSPRPEQTPYGEPQIKQVIPFDRVGDIVDEFKRQEIGKAEFCLVGWNVGGHDGRWPQIFPVEPSLGGESRLRALIRKTQDAGYQIVAHGNHRDAYIIADCWDAEYILKNSDGTIPRTKTSWGGGRMYVLCPQRAYERFASRDVFQVADLGFRGLAYYDVFSCVSSPRCEDPRHPLNERQSSFYIGRMMQLARDAMGGSASEGSWDHFCGEMDSVLYVSFSNPKAFPNKMVDRLVPIWQLVYNGIIVSNPFTETVNFTAKERYSLLKTLEFGGRPNFYFYSKFKSDGKSWMGDTDLGCATDEELRASVRKVKEGWDIYSKLSRLQLEFMEGHGLLAKDVYRTVYSDGTEIITNYGDTPFTYKGTSVAAQNYAVLEK